MSETLFPAVTPGGPLDQRQRYDDYQEAHQTAHDGRQAQIHTSQPGMITSFDAAAGTVKVQPATQATQSLPDGTRRPVTVVPLQDVPVHFPAGGGYTLTFPIAKDDEALLIHQHRSIDNWHTMGGTQPISDYRMHDINDAVALVGLRSKPRALSGVHTGNAQFRSDDGSRYVEINNGGDTIRIVVGSTTITVNNASGTVEVVAKTIKLTASDTVDISAPNVLVKSPNFSSTA